MEETLTQLFAFIKEIDKEKLIGRQTYLTDGMRKENDAEHAWHMAVMVLLFSEFANEKIDVLRTISMLLIHDIVEIDAGETPEAKFARTMDNLQPLFLNACTEGKAWMEHGVSLDQILKRNDRTAEGSEVLWNYAKKHWIEPNLEKGRIQRGKDL